MDFQKLVEPSVTAALPGEVGATWTLNPAPVETFTKGGVHYECLGPVTSREQINLGIWLAIKVDGGPVTFIPESEYASLTQGMRHMPWI